jgi:FkbH-like protein
MHKALQYPFDPQLILKKRRSIKKELLSGANSFIDKKIAVLGGSTTHDIISITELFLLNFGIRPIFYESEFGQWWQDAMFCPQELFEFSPDVVFIHTSSRNITSFPAVSDSDEQTDKLLDAEFARFESAWQALKDKFGSVIIIQNNFELPYFRLLGNSDTSNKRGHTNFINRLNMKFADYAAANSGFYINDINYLSADYGLSRWSAPFYWHMYKYCLALDAIPEFAFNLASIIKSIYGKNKKALALDLDNTLWGGVVGDDGVEGIEIGHETSMGQVYSEFQKYLKDVSSIGITLNVNSKNEHENAMAGLNHPESTLKPKDFIVIKANWETKDRNLFAIAKELNIGTDSIVFIDDNPAERAMVTASLPETEAPDIGSPESYIGILDRSRFFEVTKLSSDDVKRNEMYRQNAARAAEQTQFADYGDYLRSLNMKAVIRDFEPIYIPRIAQLTNKSNQFNLTTLRISESEMENISKDDRYIRLYGKLSDKYGDNGVITVVIGQKENDKLHIKLWLMSCRVLKRDMELAMLDSLVDAAKAQGIKKLYGYYYKTAKNAMVKEFYGTLGFKKLSETEDSSEWELDISDYQNKNKVIEVES